MIKKEKHEGFIKNNIRRYYPIMLFGSIWFVLQYLMKAWTGDEYLYHDLLNTYSVFGVAKHYYNTWSSRIILDVLAAITHHYPLIIFKCINTIVLMAEYLGIIKLCRDESIRMQWLVFGLLSMFHYACFYDCGFSITSLYYVWPVTAGIWAVYLCLSKNKSRFIAVYALLEIVLVLIACNMEQIMVLVLGIECMVLLRQIYKKAIHPCTAVGVAFSAVSTVFSFTAPGKSLRITAEIANSFPEFSMLSFWQKINMGLSTTMQKTVFAGNITWIAMTVLLAMLFITSDKEKWEKVIGCIPAFLCLVFGPFYHMLSGMFPYIYKLKEVGYYGIGDLTDFDAARTWVPLLLIVFFWASLFISVWLLFDAKYEGWMIIGLLLLGLLSRIAIAFSPTVYSSGDRTFYPLWIAVVITAALLYTKEKETTKKIISFAAVVCGVLSLVIFSASIR